MHTQNTKTFTFLDAFYTSLSTKLTFQSRNKYFCNINCCLLIHFFVRTDFFLCLYKTE